MRNTRYKGQVHLSDLIKRDIVGVIANEEDGRHWRTSLRADLTVDQLRDIQGAFNEVVEAQIRLKEAEHDSRASE
jgi:hypothetical protein